MANSKHLFHNCCTEAAGQILFGDYATFACCHRKIDEVDTRPNGRDLERMITRHRPAIAYTCSAISRTLPGERPDNPSVDSTPLKPPVLRLVVIGVAS